MTLDELRAQCRVLIDDRVEPYLWGDDDLRLYLNEAEREACLRARLLRTTETIEVVPDVNTYDIDEPYFALAKQSRYIINGRTFPIRATSRDVLDKEVPDWRMRTGHPVSFVHLQDDPVNPQIILSRVPKVAATLQLDVWHYPLIEMEDGDDEPSIESSLHMKLLDWAAYLAFSRRDSDANSEALASKHQDQFERWFGPRPTANMRRQHEDRGAQIIQYNPF